MVGQCERIILIGAAGAGRTLLLAGIMAQALGIACAQTTGGAGATVAAPPKPAKQSERLISGSIRVREEMWDWFETPRGRHDNSYAFTGGIARVAVAKAFDKTEVRAEVAAPFLFGLPRNAIAMPPQGTLGLGATYRVVNGSQNGALFFKQLWIAPSIGSGQTVRAGRLEFSDAGETVPGNPNLAYVKRERLAQRLIGPFNWSHVGRSFDGATYALSRQNVNLTALAAYPTQGVFDLDGAQTLTSVRIGYVAATLPHYASKTSFGEERVFALAYHDGRKLNKTDNMTVKDQDAINLYAGGIHVLRGGRTRTGTWDALGWGVLEGGKWGRINQRAFAYAVEGGYQFGTRPDSIWLRGGYFQTSGDGNGTNVTHSTFYAPLSTPRLYARTPFYTESNLNDGFVQLLYRPTPRIFLRADAHTLRLASGSDLWYTADGPFQTRPNFGLFGRPAGGKRDLGRLYDLSVDWTATRQDSFVFYFGQMQGGDVVRHIYPDDARGSFAYVEATHKF